MGVCDSQSNLRLRVVGFSSAITLCVCLLRNEITVEEMLMLWYSAWLSIVIQALSKTVITRKEWEKKINDVKSRKEDMNKLVMNFLVTEGYVEAAEKFRMESGTEPDIDLATITDRWL
ncbi:hypothetical protein MLD38_029009 [Melastoma candidum]|uniref:Uncharacterized protein n=1 Tax=Melastoma candidum TaxID=119954 RepID=A0ACB9N4J4_9MYRT|nr:hypothetical protein MLD38_029009 [Melastoma candidum]